MNKAIFLDRDGVLLKLPKDNEWLGFTLKEEEVFILPGVVEALKSLKKKGYLLIVITNQPAVARGIVSYEHIEKIHKFVNMKLRGLIDYFYFCPHHPEMHDDVPEQARKYRIVCDCRKPAPGMILQAAEKFGIDINDSWMIGDMITDVATGEAAGCKTIMIESVCNDRPPIISGKPFNKNVKPNKYAKNLLDATKFL